MDICGFSGYVQQIASKVGGGGLHTVIVWDDALHTILVLFLVDNGQSPPLKTFLWGQ